MDAGALRRATPRHRSARVPGSETTASGASAAGARADLRRGGQRRHGSTRRDARSAPRLVSQRPAALPSRCLRAATGLPIVRGAIQSGAAARSGCNVTDHAFCFRWRRRAVRCDGECCSARAALDPPAVLRRPKRRPVAVLRAQRRPVRGIEWARCTSSDGAHPNADEQSLLWLMNTRATGPERRGRLSRQRRRRRRSALHYFDVDLGVLMQEFAAIGREPPAAFDARLHAAAYQHRSA
jgi:hypothetical protein